VSELLDDLEHMSEDTVWETVSMRWQGLKMLRRRLGDKAIDFKPWGGYELFDNSGLFNACLEQTEPLNCKVKEVLGLKQCYARSTRTKQFETITGALFNQYEGQIDTGQMMRNLALCAHQHGIEILNNIAITRISDTGRGVELDSPVGLFQCTKAVVATNGFAAELLRLPQVKPARAQVLITKPIPGLKIKGTYHYQQGYYYFRNIDDRILFGGGRNLDMDTETTTSAGLNPKIQKQLDHLLKEMILPGQAVEVEARWSGIMGVGREKAPIIKLVSKNVLAAVRMGGMGIAIGSWVGEQAAKELM
jgi:glycine/D-amino acid oxidase-like deaminating enzyme